MYAPSCPAPARRRGVVLVLILAMLSLLALIGFSFASLTGQAQVGGRKYAEGALTPTSDSVMDFALAQLINDTTGPTSPLYGHSLKRDMYGNDAFNNGGPVAGALTSGGTSVTFNGGNYLQYTANTPNNSGLNLTRWVLRLDATTTSVAQTLEILQDSVSGTGHTLIVTNPDSTTSVHNYGTPLASSGAAYTVSMSQPVSGSTFVADGRFLRAFNGEGLAAWGYAVNNVTTYGQNGNFRVSGVDPNNVGMDEDYDAPDLENWFLALQSADGSIVIPSFHRPGIIDNTATTGDWATNPNVGSPKILRPRQIDGHDAAAFPDLTPDLTGTAATNPNYGKITLDVDNDADGVKDSVWLDLGFPAQRDATGKLYKPMFSLMVLGTNGRLPLNTAGNLQGRLLATAPYDNALGITPQPGDPTYNHTSHIGASVNEINPLYALQNAADTRDASGNAYYSQFDNAYTTGTSSRGTPYNVGVPVSVTQLRNLLTGTRIPSVPNNSTYTNTDANTVQVNGQTFVMGNNVHDLTESAGPTVRQTPTVEGRWGEGGLIPMAVLPNGMANLYFNNIVRAGRSNTLPTSPVRLDWDSADDDSDSFDFYPGAPESFDFYDLAGANLLPSERIRRYVKPIDPVGTGRLVSWGDTTSVPTQFAYSPASGTQGGYGTGFDNRGRVSYWGYFRPPGLPTTLDYSTSGYSPAVSGTQPTINAATSPDLSNNTLNGYESQKNPAGANAVNQQAAMPFNNGGTAVPTFVGPINSEEPTTGPPPNNVVTNGYLMGSLNRDEADEMNVFVPSKFDSPFGPEDLEWLYRQHDVDGASLQSRLANLAPISFLNPQDGVYRRRMFSVDSWETTNFAYAHDNPGNTFPFNSHSYAGTPAAISGDPNPYRLNSAGLYGRNYTATTPAGLPTPSLAHRDRKINLNFPLPVSNDPNEPVRQKWIAESYALLKAVLPPEAVDAPEERVQLCQYLVNVIDFRDPDGAITQFTMPDVEITTAAPTTYPTAVFSGGNPLTLYGMEYCPIAFSEVLAYSFRRGATSGPKDTPRLFVELVNTLTQANTPANIPSTVPVADRPTWNPSDVDLTGWDMVLIAEDPAAAGAANGDNPTSRPDPLTGQIPYQPGTNPAKIVYMPLSGRGPGAPHYSVPSLPAPGGTPHFVLSNYLQDPTSENAYNNTTTTTTALDTPNVVYDATANPNGVLRGVLTRTGIASANVAAGTYTDADDPLAPAGTTFTTTLYQATGTGNLPPPATNTNTATFVPAAIPSASAKYYWLYLRRPANPLAPADVNNPKIVVDSIRFPFIEGGGVAAPTPVRTANRDIYSVQRLQPFRGGHAVPTPPAAAASSPPSPYGFSEQIAVVSPVPNARIAVGTPPQSFMYGVYKDVASNKYYQMTGTGGPSPAGELTQVASAAASQPIDNYTYSTGVPATNYYGDAKAIAHTLGRSPAGSVRDSWDHFAFHDRDFMSVAELLLVPGCPPGLFTKQFVEGQPISGGFAAGAPGASGGPFTTPPTIPPGAATLFGTTPRTYPYLPDNFYYTAFSGGPTYPAPYNTADATPVVNGPTGAGWHKMLGFFEVPSSANGAIGPVSSGQNFDWARQDLKPGLLNLNLIIDEEVFFGLIDDPLRMNLQLATAYTSLPAPASAMAPLIQTGTSGGSAITYPMNNRGLSYWIDNTPPTLTPPGNPTPTFNFNPTHSPADTFVYGMKAAFSDFLKLRHGGSNVLFGGGADRPFRDITYPDINLTVMRPAALPPVGTHTVGTAPATYTVTVPSDSPRDPGIKTSDPNFGAPPTAGTTQGPPPIPARRLIQIPDDSGSSTPGPPPTSNANIFGDTNFNNLSPPIADLTSGLTSGGTDVYLGGNTIPAGTSGSPPAIPDRREHPVFRTEWLQKVMNLTTVRTHQYAVWVTVGFFEVNAQGNPQASPPVPDTIGPELGAADGHNVRYRSFFLLDRTRAAGYNPQDPGDFRDVITYRRRIE